MAKLAQAEGQRAQGGAMTSVALSPEEEVAQLRAEQRRVADLLREAQSRLPQETPLQRIQRKQSEQFDTYVLQVLGRRVRARTQAGQEQAQALADVLAVTGERVTQWLVASQEQEKGAE